MGDRVDGWRQTFRMIDSLAQEPLERIAELSSPRRKVVAAPEAMKVCVGTCFGEHVVRPFYTLDLRDCLVQPRWWVTDIGLGLFVTDAQPEAALDLSLPAHECGEGLGLPPMRPRLAERGGEERRAGQGDVDCGQATQTQSCDQVLPGGEAGRGLSQPSQDVSSDKLGKLRAANVVRMSRFRPTAVQEDQGHGRDPAALRQ